MTDQALVNWILGALFRVTAPTTYTPGTGGPSAWVVTPPFHVRLMSAQGSNTSAGTEQSAAGGYPAGGMTLGSQFAGTVAAGAFTSANSVTFTATATWSPSTQTAIEVWDTAGTPVRYLQGALTSNVTGVANGDTVVFTAGSISVSAAAW